MAPSANVSKDWLKRDHADMLARKIRAYWAERGYVVRTWLVEHLHDQYSVRSNMVNGMPITKASK